MLEPPVWWLMLPLQLTCEALQALPVPQAVMAIPVRLALPVPPVPPVRLALPVQMAKMVGRQSLALSQMALVGFFGLITGLAEADRFQWR